MSKEHQNIRQHEKNIEEHRIAEKPIADVAITKVEDNRRQESVKRQDAIRSYKITKDGQSSFCINMGDVRHNNHLSAKVVDVMTWTCPIETLRAYSP
jgi:hypothetical protein